MKVLVVVMVSVLLVGCAGPVQDNKHDSKYGPTKQNTELSVTYLNQGIKPVRDARREDAYKTMYEQCNGDYSIIREGNTQGNDRFLDGVDDVGTSSSQAIYRKIIFACN